MRDDIPSNLVSLLCTHIISLPHTYIYKYIHEHRNTHALRHIQMFAEHCSWLFREFLKTGRHRNCVMIPVKQDNKMTEIVVISVIIFILLFNSLSKFHIENIKTVWCWLMPFISPEVERGRSLSSRPIWSTK